MTLLLDHLNHEQQRAVTAPLDLPVLVVAGAGSGKTTTLAHRVAWMVDQGIDGNQTVAMTFTRRAAEELRERFTGLGVAGVDLVWAGTMHSFAYHRLKHHLNPDPAWTVITNPKRHIRRLRGRADDEYREALDHMPEIDLAQVIGRIGRWQDELVSPAEAIEDASMMGDWSILWTAKMYDAYTRWKRRTNHIDFGDMLMMLVEFYEEHPSFAIADRGLFPHCLVDELQDTNTAQWRLLELVWRTTPLFGVGDPRQAIYQWRGARPDQLLGFNRLWPDAIRLTLDFNYRSRAAILAPAQALIDHAPAEERIVERMVAVRDGGDPPIVTYTDGQGDEAVHVAASIMSLLAQGHECGDLAILYRTNAQSVDFEDQLAAAQVPYQVVGSSGFWGRREVVDMLAYLRLVLDPEDVDSFTRALKAPSRYLGAAFITACIKLAGHKNMSLVDAAGTVTSTNGRILNRGQLDEASMFSNLVGVHLAKASGPAQAISDILRSTDYRSWLRKEEGASDDVDDDRMEALDKLVEAAARFGTIAELLEHAEKQTSKSSASAKRDPERVQLLTVHRAKGLEWPAVFVAGMADGLIPHHRAEKTEERRLAYVAMTRAKDRLELTVPGQTFRGPCEPSPFLKEAGLLGVFEQVAS